MTHALVFQNTTFDIVDRNGQPWLKGTQIADALGYADEKAVTRIYARNADEFTDAMTGVVNLTPSGNLERETRIFSLRGCHLLAMLSRTVTAKAFRRWVLDILDRETGRETQPLPDLITPGQAGELATLLAERFPDGKDRPYAWSRFNNHFRIARYRELPASRFAEARDYLGNMPMKNATPALAAPAFDPREALQAIRDQLDALDALAAPQQRPDPCAQLCALAETINDLGLWYLVGKAEEVAKEYPRQVMQRGYR